MALIQQFNLSSDLDAADEHLAAAVERVTGQPVAVLKSWWGGDKQTSEMLEEIEGPVNIEWLMRKGLFKLDLRIYGQGISLHFTEAQFARALAKELTRPLLFSDCSAFPFSYFRAKPDGAIDYVVVTIDDEENFDLLTDDPTVPNHFIPQMIYGPEEPLPQKPPGDGAAMPRDVKATCDKFQQGAICEQFWSECPKRTRLKL
ncbi:MAG TPA: hypothetical protein VH000_08205 [Rhizomicrobium sp.]|jgi:hypothetical protein|nr:hypothetical protein [Rhizomicrobium sp.]